MEFIPDRSARTAAYDALDREHEATKRLLREATAEVERLRAALAESEVQVRAVVPLGDLSGVAAWTAADAQYRERIAHLEAALSQVLREADTDEGAALFEIRNIVLDAPEE